MPVNSLDIDTLAKIRIQDKFWMYPNSSLPVGGVAVNWEKKDFDEDGKSIK